MSAEQPAPARWHAQLCLKRGCSCRCCHHTAEQGCCSGRALRRAARLRKGCARRHLRPSYAVRPALHRRSLWQRRVDRPKSRLACWHCSLLQAAANNSSSSSTVGIRRAEATVCSVLRWLCCIHWPPCSAAVSHAGSSDAFIVCWQQQQQQQCVTLQLAGMATVAALVQQLRVYLGDLNSAATR
jgi:hypothetical protein